MADTLTWRFQARDLISGPLGGAGRSVDDFGRRLLAADARIRGLSTTSGNLSETVGTAVQGLGRLAGVATAVTGIAVGIGGAFLGVAASIGRSVTEMIRFRESAVTTFGVLLGGQGAGNISRVGGAAFRQTQAIARLTPGNERDINTARQQAITAGFRGRDEERVLSASLDVGALMQNDPTAQGRFVRALGQIRGRGALQAEELNQLAEVGVSRQGVFAAIARQRGLRGTETENNRAVQDLMRQGRITGEEGVNAALASLRQTTGQRLGGFAVARGSGLAGAMSNLEEAFFGLVTGINQLENLPGVRAFAASITAIANAFNGSSEAGQKLQRSVAGIINEAAGMFAGVFTPQRIEGFVSTLADVLPPLFQAMREVGGAFIQGLGRALGPLLQTLNGDTGSREQWLAFAMSFADALGYLVGVSVQVVAGFAALGSVLTIVGAEALRFVQFILSLPQQFGSLATQGWTTIGTAIVDGITSGITSGYERVTGAVRGLADNAITAARETLGIASPSRVFAEIGGYTAEGFERGVHGGTQGAQDAMAAMVAPPDAAGAAGALAGRGGVFQVFVDGAGREALGIVDEIEQRMGVTFDRLALSGGTV